MLNEYLRPVDKGDILAILTSDASGTTQQFCTVDITPISSDNLTVKVQSILNAGIILDDMQCVFPARSIPFLMLNGSRIGSSASASSLRIAKDGSSANRLRRMVYSLSKRGKASISPPTQPTLRC
jgi:hypothetical protein